ncbi:hypothetical protein MKW94_013358 [Papaver nudicaule]|uniref:SAM-dependent MTase DRM-type domain-containing protein n=1 Tax=Papaver nudicaule TaxID=74823 RepID=A0AA41VKQ2_PAPNU|nr:hypothetical protein [Papaver nudicaule]
MGFSEDLVVKALHQNEGKEDQIIVDSLLLYATIEESSPQLPDEDKKMLELLDMGFNIDEVSSAINACDPDTSTAELMDHIYAARIADHSDQTLEISKVDGPLNGRKKKFFAQENQRERELGSYRSNEIMEREKRIKLLLNADECILKPTLGRRLPNVVAGPPYIYLEKCGFPPQNWSNNTSSLLHNLELEFVDSKSFCAIAKNCGYFHNLPMNKRSRLLPILPLTIKEALPHTSEWWPSWDSRIQFESLRTCYRNPKPVETIRKAFESCGGGEPPSYIQKIILGECQRNNLVWIGRNRVSLLDLKEMESLLGYPIDYTRGVAYHLSVLKELFPSGISVLSIFPGLGGAAIALYRLGVPLKLVVTVENVESNRRIFRNWWDSTEQRGMLIDNMTNVNMLTSEVLENLVGLHGGFDLIIGGSQYNDTTGRSRDYLEEYNSSLFHEYSRILDKVRCLMGPK